jgi:hypothetical protein
MTWPLALLILAQALAWVGLLVLGTSWALGRHADPATTRHLWIVQSDAASSVRAIKDAGPYDWAADEPAGGAA